MWWPKRKPATPLTGLDTPLDIFGGGLPFDIRMATEGTVCFGELGAGKTLLAFRRYLSAFIPKMGGCIFQGKSEDSEWIPRIFEKYGASNRLRIVRPRGQLTLNWLEELVRIAPAGAEAEEVVGGLMSLSEIDGRSAASRSDETSNFFKTKSSELLAAVVIILRMAGVKLTPANIYKFLIELPQSQADLASERWLEASCANRWTKLAHDAQAVIGRSADYDQSRRLLFGELVDLYPPTRSSIVSTLSGVLSKLLKGWVADLLATETTFDLQEMFTQKRWFLFDVSPLEWGEYGTSVLVAIKHLIQRLAMRRMITAESLPFAMMADEFQQVFVTSDRDFAAVCRQKLACCWYATQNMTGAYAVLGGERAAESLVKSFLSLQACKIFFANTDWETNKYASELCGETLQRLGSWTSNEQYDISTYDRLMGRSNINFTVSEQYLPSCRPEVWVSLKKPSPPHFDAEAIMVMPRLQPLTGCHWKKIRFSPLG